jgi:hypothetical protein
MASMPNIASVGVSAEQLKAAVKAVGSNAEDVEAHLKSSKR